MRLESFLWQSRRFHSTRSKPSFRQKLATLGLLVMACCSSLRAADATWKGGSGTQAWSTNTNWNPEAAPGATTGTTNADIATFNTGLGATAITIDAGRNLRSLTFATGVASPFTIGSAGANSGEALHLSSGGTIIMNSGITGAVTVDAPMVIEPTSGTGAGSYTFENNATSADNDTNPFKMTLNGSISGGATTGTVTLNFKGSTGNRSTDSSANVVNGLISNGLAGSVAVNVTGLSNQRGVWRFNNNNNSYTGTTTLSQGTLLFTSIANAGANSSLGAGNAIIMGAGVHLKYVGGATSTDRAISGTGAFYNNGSGALTLNGTVAAGLTFRGGNNFIVNGLISGSGGISRTDSGTVFLNNNSNSFTGDVTASDGAFRAGTVSNNGTNSAIGNNGRIVLGQGSTTVGRFEYSGSTASTDRLILMRNDAAGAFGRGIVEVVTAGQTLTFTSGVRVNSSTVANLSELTLRGSGNGEIQGVIGGTVANAAAVVSLQIIKTGTGTWTLSGANTYARTTTVTGGILNVRHSSALGAVMSNEAVPTAAGAGTTVGSGGTLQLQNDISVGAEALSIAGSGASGQTGALVNVSGTNAFAGAVTLTADSTLSSDSGRLNLTHTGAVVGSGGSKALTLAGAGEGSLAGSLDSGITTLTKNGTGRWTLSGANAHTGVTVVNAGTLNVTGSFTGTGLVTANSGGTFAGSGSLAGGLTVANGGTLMIGDAETAGSTGTLTVNGPLTLNNTSSLLFDLGTSSDLLQANGATLTLDGVVTVTKGAGFAAGTYKLIDYTGTLTDNGLTAQMLAGYDLSVAVDTANTDVNLIVAAINAQYWDGGDTVADGIVDGGSGVWTNANTNWTLADGSNNTSWADSVEKIAIFEGVTGGTVQVQDDVAVNGLQFGKDYTLAAGGGSIQLTNAAAEMRVVNGITATIAAPVAGAGGLNKTGEGTLVFTAPAGANTYAGTTLLTAGTFKIGATNTLPTGTALVIGASTGTVGAITPVAAFDLSEAGQQVASLQVASNSTLNNTVTIGAGQTLTVNGAGGFRVGIVNTAKAQTRVVFSGAGALVVNNTAANFESGIQTATTLLPGATSPFDNAANANTSVTDLSGLGSFTANVNEFRVAHGLNDHSTLTLSNTSNSITANVVNVANSAGHNSGSGLLILGTGTNVIATNALNIGVSKGGGTLRFASQTAGSPGTVVIGGKTTAAVDITVASSLTTATGASPGGTLDLRGHIATVTADDLIIGRRSSSGNGGTTGNVYFDAGTFTANKVEIGTMSGDAIGNAAGQLTVGGGVFTVNSGGSLTLGTFANTTTTGTATGSITISGGTFITHVDILEGGGAQSTSTNTVTTLNLSGGTLDMTGHHIGDATNTINILNLTAGTLKDVGQINGGADISKTGTGTLVIQGDSGYTGATTVSAGSLLISNDPSGAGSATGTNNVSVATNASFGGNGRVAGSVTLATGANLAPGGNATTVAAGAPGLSTDTGTLRIVGSLDVAAGATLALNLKTPGSHGLTATFNPETNRLTSISGVSTDGGNDRVIVDGTFTLDGASNITVTAGTGFNPGYQDTYDLLDWTGMTIPATYYDDGDGLRTGGATDNASYFLDLPDLTVYNPGWVWDVGLFGSTGVIAIVPEPSRSLLTVFGLAVLVLRRRRKAQCRGL